MRQAARLSMVVEGQVQCRPSQVVCVLCVCVCSVFVSQIGCRIRMRFVLIVNSYAATQHNPTHPLPHPGRQGRVGSRQVLPNHLTNLLRPLRRPDSLSSDGQPSLRSSRM